MREIYEKYEEPITDISINDCDKNSVNDESININMLYNFNLLSNSEYDEIRSQCKCLNLVR